MCLNTQLTEQQSPSLGLPWSHCVLMPSRDSELVRKDSLGLGISSADGYSLIWLGATLAGGWRESTWSLSHGLHTSKLPRKAGSLWQGRSWDAHRTRNSWFLEGAVGEKEEQRHVSRSNNSPVISDRASVGMEVFLSGAEKESVAVRHCLKIGGGRQAACRWRMRSFSVGISYISCFGCRSLSFFPELVSVCVFIKFVYQVFPHPPSVFFSSIVYQLFSTVAGTHRNSGSSVVFSLAFPHRLIKLRHTCSAVQPKGRAVLRWSCPWKETAQVLSSLQFYLLFSTAFFKSVPWIWDWHFAKFLHFECFCDGPARWSSVLKGLPWGLDDLRLIPGSHGVRREGLLREKDGHGVCAPVHTHSFTE